MIASASRAAPPPAQAVPASVAMPPPIPAPRDVPYPGTLRLAVDATDLDRRIFTVHETVPVAHAGDTVLLLPHWLPGDHGPDGDMSLLASLVIHAGGARIGWVRDPVDMFAFHVAVPNGATALDLDFQSLSPTEESEGRVVMTPRLLNLEWNNVALYPAGYLVQDIPVSASIRVPDGWHLATALLGPAEAGAAVGHASFPTVPFNVLIDSPLIAGANFTRVTLSQGDAAPVHLDVVADTAAELAMTPAQEAVHRALVVQAERLFDAHHYDHYDFLLMLSDQLGGQGLEHHRSSEDAVDGNYFSAWDKTVGERDLLAHEYTHSWNGKFRRPADLWSPNYDVPERDSLLWVYEGLTEYWGQVLAARSGLWNRQQALDMLAADAADLQQRPGRAWRTLEDTTNDPIFKQRRPISWNDWQRDEDYYVGGLLVWLDADTLIRERTHGAKSLDDFARAFFGMSNGRWDVSTYTLDDVVRALGQVCPYDWAGFFHERLDTNPSHAPLDGIARGGYRLVFTDTQSPIDRSLQDTYQRRGFAYSIGLDLEDAKIADVAWGGPAAKAGLVVGDRIVGIDGMTFNDADDLATAIRDAHTGGKPIEILVTSGHTYRVVSVPYSGGLRYPHLERVGGSKAGPGPIDRILAPVGRT